MPDETMRRCPGEDCVTRWIREARERLADAEAREDAALIRAAQAAYQEVLDAAQAARRVA